MKRFFALALLTVAAVGQEPLKIDDSKVLYITARPPEVRVELGTNYTYQSESGKGFVLDKDGKVVKDDGLTRDELIQLMHKITLSFVDGQKFWNDRHDAEIEKYKQIIALYDQEVAILKHNNKELVDGLKEIQKLFSPPVESPKAKGAL